MQSRHTDNLVFCFSPFGATFSRGAVCFLVLLTVFGVTGCGTTKWSDTSRTATEQLLLTHAMDKAVEKIDFQALAAKKVTIDSKAIDGATDNKYLVSVIRQHLLASGASVCDMDDADYVLELRAGAVGTDRNDLFYGIPSFSLPTGLFGDSTAGTTAIPEVAFIKITDQKAVVKVAMFAYNKHTNKAVWQSGSVPAETRINAKWFFGSGPWMKGDLYEGTELAGAKMPELNIPIIIESEAGYQCDIPELTVTQPAYFIESIEESDPALGNKSAETPTADAESSDTQAAQAPVPTPAPPAPGFPNNAIFLPQLTHANDQPANVADVSPVQNHQNFSLTPSRNK